MTNEMFRRLVKWFGLVLLGHFAIMIIYNLFLASYVAQISMQNYSEAKMTMLFFSMIIPPIVLFIKEKISTSMVESRRLLKLVMKEEEFSLIGYFKKNFLKETLLEIGVYAAIQLPFIILASIRTPLTVYVLVMLERFYMLEYGFYINTMFWIGNVPVLLLGWLLATLYFAVVYIAIKLLCMWMAKRSIEIV